ncbi:uncharacterized protein MONOS_14016 [Monocercomonoides exilis]|uniref:uncharacterized protein n=1 Tax=Monocercomonoides exilis TaxID=2049356 RepID=UPI00355A9A0B|nr:hypothetical protein MONOS_14016 [Monocercomonoides exilis]|eukprot:MONOS_14016.1-p1 / transcript=MONOS_14016.1 / gene=MONOS_14016 / organism=Monocercomonoides_exilis_PA203 / gene_product=unspecified product / transcript_product=unspecified product / location=Mono_scaffold00921:13869-15255(-) / protein_length=214 / sequence_SO=supercontig / SO=protein_coding / is_pseudo=false
MKVRLAKDRREALTRLCARWEKDCEKARIVKVKDLASFIGKFNAVRLNYKRDWRVCYPESTTGESSSDITPAELEGTELGKLVEIHSAYGIDQEESEGGSVEVSIDAMDRYESSTRSIEDNQAECTLRDGEQWWKNALEQKSVPFSSAEECRAGISRSTWRGYLYGFAHFGKQWKECGHGRISDSIQMWFACCANMFLSLRKSGMKSANLPLT